MKPTTARLLAHRLFSRVRGGTLRVSDPHDTRAFGRPGPSGQTPLEAAITVHDPRFYGCLLSERSIGLGESYADGWWDADNLTAVLRLAHRSLSRVHPLLDRVHRALTPVVDPITRRRRPDQKRDRHNVRAHYDLGNDLFQSFLDPTMMYSCAVFDAPARTLEEASRAKLDRLARLLELAPGDRVLEIGTGWGGFAIYAAREHGCHVTTTTISAEQHAFATRRVREAGLEHRVTVLDADYRDLDASFDKVVAIEMIEAVDWREHDRFFERCRALVVDDGLLVLQAITVPDTSFDRTKRTTDFIKAAIFPGGCLPSVAALDDAAARHGLTLTRRDDIGPHYAETLRRWRANLDAARHELAALGYDERFVRQWDFYFSYCEAGFEERYVGDAQLLFVAPDRAALRPRRPEMLPARTLVDA
jgi:cyclopropane-fatty-acyl-phospholipid synthase